jgi:hypothetical protein
MQEQRRASGPGPREAEDPAVVILDILIGQHPSLLHVDELVRMYARGSIEHAHASPIVDDAVSELLASGLAHQLDRFVLVSRAALRAHELAS